MWIYILILCTVYIIFRMARQIIGNRGHLTEEDIREYKYRRRSLSEPAQRRITNHVGVCDKCRERFTQLMNE